MTDELHHEVGPAAARQLPDPRGPVGWVRKLVDIHGMRGAHLTGEFEPTGLAIQDDDVPGAE